MYDTFACNVGDEIVALQATDTPTCGACFPACSQLPGQTQPMQYNFFMPQFSSLWGWRSSGNSSYNAMNLTLRRSLRAGVQFDVNYAFSKSIDVGSNAERVNVFDTVGGFSSQVINSWQPNQHRAVSDFDMRHQPNSNWVIDLPVGRGKKLGSTMSRLADAVVSGWSVTGLFRRSSGLPFSVFPAMDGPPTTTLPAKRLRSAIPGRSASIKTLLEIRPCSRIAILRSRRSGSPIRVRAASAMNCAGPAISESTPVWIRTGKFGKARLSACVGGIQHHERRSL